MKLISTDEIVIKRYYYGEKIEDVLLKGKIKCVKTIVRQEGKLLYSDLFNTPAIMPKPLISYLNINPQNNQVKNVFNAGNNGRCRFYFRFKRWLKRFNFKNKFFNVTL